MKSGGIHCTDAVPEKDEEKLPVEELQSGYNFLLVCQEKLRILHTNTVKRWELVEL